MKRTLRLPIVVAIALLFSAQAQPPSAAFDYVSIDAMMAMTDVEQARAELARSRLGLSGALDFDPNITYGVDDVADPDAFPEFDFGFNADLGLDFRYDSVAILGDEIDLISAESRLADRRRTDIEAALIAHTDLLRAMTAVGIEQSDLEREQENFNEVQADVEANEATAAELEDARIDLDADRLALERAELRLSNARSNAVRYGVGPNPRFEIFRFELPDAAPELTFDYRRLVLLLRRADALGLQNSAFGVLEDITLGAFYGTDELNVGVNANLNRGRPGAGIDAEYEFTGNDLDPTKWEIELSLSLRLDDRTVGDFAAAERDLAEAQLDLEEFLADFSGRAIRERQDAEFAWQDLQLAVRQLDNDRTRRGEVSFIVDTLPSEVAELRQNADRLRADRDAATGDERQNLDGQVRDADAALRDAESALRSAQSELASLGSALPRDEDALFREWGEYVRAVEDYLNVVDGTWVVAE